MNREKIKEKLEKMLAPRRYVHSLNVMHTAEQLAEFWGEDNNKAGVAGLLHDCARGVPLESVLEQCEKYGLAVDKICHVQPKLLHGPLGAVIAKHEFGVEDEAILHAISCHTMGSENMSLLDKIVCLADYIEPNRRFPGVNSIRKIAYNDIDEALILSLDRTIKHIMLRGGLIHPDTICARNNLLLKRT